MMKEQFWEKNFWEKNFGKKNFRKILKKVSDKFYK